MKRTNFLLRSAFAAMLLTMTATWPTAAEVRLPALFSDHMVIQADTPVRVWGWADAGEVVTVELAGQSKAATADGQGAWRVEFDALEASEQPTQLKARAGNEVTVDDVLIGEVWVCAGQSNMWWPVSRTTDAAKEIAQAKDTRLRLFTVPVAVAAEPQQDIDLDPEPVTSKPPEPAIRGQWFVASPDTIGDFSGVGYYFGRELIRNQKRPVGIISAAVGGTIVSSWTSRDGLSKTPAGPPIVEYWDMYAKDLYPQKLAEYKQRLAAWEASQADGSDAVESEPQPPVDASRYVNTPAALFNAMVSPLTDFPIRGVVWYQGESNASGPGNYEELLLAMVRDWRKAWGESDLPFAIVQLPSLDTSQYTSLGGPMDWPVIREAQAKAANELDHVGLAVTIDLGFAHDAHPPNKQQIVERLLRTAEFLAYGRESEFSGPTYADLKIDGSTAIVSFDHVDGSLKAEGSEVLGFELAGADGHFHFAEAKIDRRNNQVRLNSREVPSPEAVRYAWLDNPVATLRDGSGLPAVPFRTDDRQPKILDAAFKNADVGFWAATSMPIGWSATDPSKVYTSASRFVILSPDTEVIGQPVIVPADADRVVLRARLGGTEGAQPKVILEAVDYSNGRAKAHPLATLSGRGLGTYELREAESKAFAIPDKARSMTLRFRLEIEGNNAGYFDDLRVEPVAEE